MNYARPDDITVSVFYNKHHEEHVEFSKREIVDKFYSVDYGVLVANLGQIKTPIFGKRNLKDDVNEVKRLEVMSQAVGKLPPAKFMLFALHFDKYIEKLSDIDDDLMTGAIKNVVPVIKNGKNKILNSVGNHLGNRYLRPRQQRLCLSLPNLQGYALQHHPAVPYRRTDSFKRRKPL